VVGDNLKTEAQMERE